MAATVSLVSVNITGIRTGHMSRTELDGVVVLRVVADGLRFDFEYTLKGEERVDAAVADARATLKRQLLELAAIAEQM